MVWGIVPFTNVPSDSFCDAPGSTPGASPFMTFQDPELVGRNAPSEPHFGAKDHEKAPARITDEGSSRSSR